MEGLYFKGSAGGKKHLIKAKWRKTFRAFKESD
jgi:hypothetical protein